MKILSGHVSPETAYLVPDYPYGYTLRCKIRYWLESNKHGARLVSQTTNPKAAGFGGDVWNKPKASTYAKFAGCMVLDDNDHVAWAGLDEYTDAKTAAMWLETYRTGLCEYDLKRAEAWVILKTAYELLRDQKLKEKANV